MGFFEIFSIIFLVIVFSLLIMIIMGVISKSVNLKKAEKNIKVKSKNMAVAFTWLGLSAFNTFNMFMQMTTAAERGEFSRERAYLFFTITWILFFIYSLIMIVFGKYAYITENKIIMLDVIRSGKCKQNCRYKINGESVEIYWKKLKTPWKYEIIENKDELTKMLENNYIQHEE